MSIRRTGYLPFRLLAWGMIAASMVAGPLVAGDWPTWQHDIRRTGKTDTQLATPLRLAWMHEARRPPAPAWPEEARNDYYHDKYNMPDRVVFDRVFHVVGGNGRVFYGSSAENFVACLDLATGHEVWHYVAEGPVRLAPTLHEGRLYFGSDDGCVYCLEAATGKRLWRQAIALSPRIIGCNQRPASAWPVRTDVILHNGRAHACAGVFPSQGVVRCELDPQTGEVLARHTLAATAQGYLELKFGKLMIAAGRNPTGLLADPSPAPAGEEKDSPPTAQAKLPPEATAVTQPAKGYLATLTAGNLHVGAQGAKLLAWREKEAEPVWQAETPGSAYGLAVVGDRLLASTDRGLICCFAPAEETAPAAEAIHHKPAAPEVPAYASPADEARFAAAAETVASAGGVAQGYCLLLGLHSGHLAHELAQRTEWQIVVREPDEQQAAIARNRFHAAGLGHRVTVQAGGLEALPYASHLFNVVTSESVINGQELPTPRAEALRVTRPHGGCVLYGLSEGHIERRGPLPGEGTWTHLYGNAANTACSGDTLVKNELELQWFGKPSPREMIDRHHRPIAPLYVAGRLFVPGDDRVTGVDAYNGSILWERLFPNSRRVAGFRDSSFLAASPQAIFVAAGSECFQLDPQTGETRRTFALPAAAPGNEVRYEWGCLVPHEGLVLGSAVKAGSIRRAMSRQMVLTETFHDEVPVVGSDSLFAYETDTGTLRWHYRAEQGLIVNQTLTLYEGRVYFVESDNRATLARPLARGKLAELLGEGARITALEASSGAKVWQRSCPELRQLRHNVFGVAAHNRLAWVGSRNNLASEPARRLFYEIHVCDAATGVPAWSKTQDQKTGIGGDHGEQERHPAVVGDTLFCEPYAYRLATGEGVAWNWPWTTKQRRGCGTLSASANTLFFRSQNVQSYALEEGAAKPVTSETRPGCWINILPAGGLLLAPEASSGCSCNFSVQCSFALAPKP